MRLCVRMADVCVLECLLVCVRMVAVCVLSVGRTSHQVTNIPSNFLKAVPA